jgi:hypothetical protein
MAKSNAEAEKLDYNKLARNDRRTSNLLIEVMSKLIMLVLLIEECRPKPCIGKIGHSEN